MPIPPLTRHRPDGTLYTRPAHIEALLPVLLSLPRDQLIARAEIAKREDPDYVPSECLVHLIRATRGDNRQVWFERLFKILTARVRKALPKVDATRDKAITRDAIAPEAVRDKVFGVFELLLAEDRSGDSDKLDFFEVRFDQAIARLRLDAQEKAWREKRRTAPLEYDEETGELSPEVEKAAGSYDPFASPEIEDKNYRLRLHAAIDALPPEQSRTIHMRLQGFPIDSQDPNVMTIAKALGRTEKTIRNYWDRGVATLQKILNEGDGS